MLVFVFPSFEASASSDGEIEQDSTKTDVDFIISLSGNHSIPKELFSDNFESAFGWAAGIGISVSENDTLIGFNLNFSKNYFTLSKSFKENHGVNESAEATVTGIMLEGYVNFPLFSVKGIRVAPTLGAGFGGSRFSLADADFESLGNSTFTELHGENHNTQFCDFYRIGILLHDFGPVSLQYSYQLMSVHRTWKFFHWLVSSSIKTYLIYPMPNHVAKVLSDDFTKSLPFTLIRLAYGIGTTFLWYDITYDHNNWPFDDDPPMHYHRQLLTISIQF